MKTNYIKHAIIGIAFLSLVSYAKAQTNHSASKPFLKATQDARNIALAGASTSNSADAYSIYSNASKSVLSDKLLEIGTSFSQFRPTLNKDIRLYSASGYYNIGYNSSILAGFRYMRGVSLVANYTNTAEFSPYDYSIDLGYAYSPISNLSLAVVTSFTDSKLLDNTSYKDLVFGLSATYKYNITEQYDWTTALNLSNIGLKLNSEAGDYNLPTNIVWGNNITANITPSHSLSASIDVIGYLLPKEAKAFEGAFGLEYTGFDILSLRGGYRLADEEKGSYSYITSGIGVKFSGISIDASYIFAGKGTPMQNAWWISASFNL